jgi:hypothetical protein
MVWITGMMWIVQTFEPNNPRKMKKRILMMTALAAMGISAYGQCPNNGTTAHTWTGLGSTESVLDANNWSTSTVPDCDDDVTFNTGTKDARIPASWEVRNILVSNGYKGKISVENSGTALKAASIDLTGTYFNFLAASGHSVIGDVTIAGNGFFNASSTTGITITGELHVSLAGYFTVRSLAVIQLGDVLLDAYSQFKSPETGRVNINGHMTAHRQATFDHRFCTFAFVGSGLQNYHFSPGSGALGSNGACQFWNVELNKQNQTAAGDDDIAGTDATDTMVVLNKLTLTDGDFRSGAGLKIQDTLNLVGAGAQGHSIAFQITGTKSPDIIVNNGATGAGSSWEILLNMHAATGAVRVWKGSAAAIDLGSGRVTVRRGHLRFDEGCDARIGGGITVVNGGRIIAPASNILTLGASWNLSGRNAFDPRTGTVRINGTGSSDWNHNNSAAIFNNLVFDGNGQTYNWSSSANDSLWVRGTLSLTDGSPRSAVVVFEGDINSGASADPRMDEFAAAGTGTQTITLGQADQLRADNLMINKTTGHVKLGADMNLNRLTLKRGNIEPQLNNLTITSSNAGGNGIVGGNVNSFINGPLRLQISSVFAGSKFRVALGKGSKFRPITIHNSSDVNTWLLEFIDADPATLGTTYNGGADAITADGYWVANRTAGGNGIYSAAAYFEVSDAGRVSGWMNAQLKVVELNGSSQWDNLGGIFTSSAVMSSNTGRRTNEDFIVTLGVDNVAPAALIDRDQVSRNELQTQRAGQPIASDNSGRFIQFSVYPNPVSDQLSFRLSGADKGVVLVADYSGRTLGTYDISETQQIPFSGHAAGVYFVTYSYGGKQITQRVIKN